MLSLRAIVVASSPPVLPWRRCEYDSVLYTAYQLLGMRSRICYQAACSSRCLCHQACCLQSGMPTIMHLLLYASQVVSLLFTARALLSPPLPLPLLPPPPSNTLLPSHALLSSLARFAEVANSSMTLQAPCRTRPCLANLLMLTFTLMKLLLTFSRRWAGRVTTNHNSLYCAVVMCDAFSHA